MREITTLTLGQRVLRRRLARLAPLAAGGLRKASSRWLAWSARIVETVVVACGLLLLPLLPLVAAVVASDRMFLQDYPAAMARIARHIRATWRGRAISRMLEHRLTPPRLRKHHDVVGACTHCGNCCLDRACVFLSFDEQGRSHCQIYGGRLWRRLSCGDYPIDASEIELYRCPSFSAVVAPVPSAGRVIPIVRVGNPPRSGG